MHHRHRLPQLDAARPFLTEDESMWRFFAPELRRRLAELEASAATADRVRAALHESLPAGDSSINGVAGQLIMSPRTLQRQLQAEGTSYQAVLTATREHLVNQLQEWSRRAEASGIQALADFSQQLRRYA